MQASTSLRLLDHRRLPLIVDDSDNVSEFVVAVVSSSLLELLPGHACFRERFANARLTTITGAAPAVSPR
jgi:hypothetical protein